MASPSKKKVAKKAPPKKRPSAKAKKGTVQKRAEKARAKAAKVPVPKPKSGKGGKMSAAEQSVRDTLMLSRKIQGFSYPEIAAEFGLNKITVEKAIKNKREATELLLDRDVVDIVEGMIEELQATAVDFEKIALSALKTRNLNSAIGAKRGAMEARRDLRELLQSVGALPHDLGTVHHIVDIRAVVIQINENVEKFVAAVEEVDLPKETRSKVLGAAKRVSGTLDEIAEAPHAVGTTNGGSDEG